MQGSETQKQKINSTVSGGFLQVLYKILSLPGEFETNQHTIKYSCSS